MALIVLSFTAPLQLRMLYSSVKVVVAPLLSGAGVKGKVCMLSLLACFPRRWLLQLTSLRGESWLDVGALQLLTWLAIPPLLAAGTVA